MTSGASGEDAASTTDAGTRTQSYSDVPLAAGEVAAQWAETDRYAVIEEIARGGGGWIAVGLDRKLGRRIALKHPNDARGAARLEQEALVMARLEHPAIVPVHDFGRGSDGMPFYAMKLLGGMNLRDRIRAATTFDARLGLLRVVGAVCDAMAYAHAHQVIHRDLKPSNVVVGEFGEVAVIDWGLAKALAAAAPGEPDAPRTRDLTQHGAVLGTAAYMPPEQAAGVVVDQRADVYALGALLYEVLTGEPPYGAGDADAQLAMVAAGPPPPVQQREPRVPRELAAIIAKAMARSPDDRYASAGELADDLHRYETGRLVAAHRYSRPARLWRWLARRRLAVVSAVAVVALGAAAVAVRRAMRPVGEACNGARERLAGVWDAEHRAAAAARFTASRLPYAVDTWRRVAAALDGYGDDWVAMHTESCRATRVDGGQPERVLDLRMACLERRRAELHALAGQLERADDGVVEHAAAAAAALTPVAGCGDLPALEAQAAAHRGGAIDEPWRTRLAEVKAVYDVGRWRDAVVAGQALARDADARGNPAVRAEAWARFGGFQVENGDVEAAEPTLHTALRLCGEAGNDVLAVHVVGYLAIALAQTRARRNEALAVSNLAPAYLARAGGDDLLHASQLVDRSEVLEELDRHDDTRAALVEAIALLSRHVADDDLRLARATVMLARSRHRAGDDAQATALYQRALGSYEHRLGPDHPTLAQVLDRMGVAARAQQRYNDALGFERRALAIRQRVFGDDSLETAESFKNIGHVYRMLGRGDDAAAGYERALAIIEAKRGPDHIETAGALGNLAVARRQQGRPVEALALHRRALAIRLAAHDDAAAATSYDNIGHALSDLGDFAGAEAQHRLALAIDSKADPPDTIDDRIAIAEAVIEQSRCAEARPELKAVIGEIEAKSGKDSAALVDPIALLGRCEVDTGHPSAAAAMLERALAIAEPRAERGEQNLDELAVVRFELARALWASGGDRARAAELAATAERALTAPSLQRDRRRITEWRRSHTAAPPR